MMKTQPVTPAATVVSSRWQMWHSSSSGGGTTAQCPLPTHNCAILWEQSISLLHPNPTLPSIHPNPSAKKLAQIHWFPILENCPQIHPIPTQLKILKETKYNKLFANSAKINYNQMDHSISAIPQLPIVPDIGQQAFLPLDLLIELAKFLPAHHCLPLSLPSDQPQQGNEARIRVLQQEMARLQPHVIRIAELQQQLDELRPFIIQYYQFSEELQTLTRQQDQQQQSSSTGHAAGQPSSPKIFFSRISSFGRNFFASKTTKKQQRTAAAAGCSSRSVASRHHGSSAEE